jgi:hypothetical protein
MGSALPSGPELVPIRDLTNLSVLFIPSAIVSLRFAKLLVFRVFLIVTGFILPSGTASE